MSKDKMKVCYVAHLPNLNGTSQSLLDILTCIGGEGIEPVVLLGKRGPLEGELKTRGVRYTVIPYSSEIKDRSTYKNFAKRIKSGLALGKVEKFFREENFDIVHSNTLLVGIGMEAAYRLGIPYICHIRDYDRSLLHEQRQRFLVKKASDNIVISESMAERFRAFAPEAKFTVMHDGIAADRYFRPHGEIFGGGKVGLLLAGRIEPRKGQLEAVQAVEYLVRSGMADLTLNIVGGVGDGEYDRKVREYVKEKNITQVNFIDFTDLDGLRAECGIGLMCSQSEPLGRVTVESMLAGMLVVGSDAGATPEIVTDGKTGLLYKAGDPEDLAEKIKYALGNADLMTKIAAAGQEYAYRAFDSGRYAAKLARLYREISEKDR